MSGLSFGLRTLFVVFVAIVLGWRQDRAQLTTELEFQESRMRDSKIKLLEGLQRIDVVGQPIAEFPGIAALADKIIDESSTEFQRYLTNLRPADENGLPYKNRRNYAFWWAIGQKEGVPTGLLVVTSNDTIVQFDVQSPEW